MPTVCAQPQLIASRPLTEEVFRSFGSVIEQNGSPIVKAIRANQGSAAKYPDVSFIENAYHQSKTKLMARPSTSLFVCSPRTLGHDPMNSSQGVFQLSIMERHPFTTQTFVPLGLHSTHCQTTYLVIVAPSKGRTGSEGDLPDLSNIRAFIARGSQAVTYGRGIWHCPMAVIGKDSVAFVVTQFVNGILQDDCEECEIQSCGPGVQVQVPNLQKLLAKL